LLVAACSTSTINIRTTITPTREPVPAPVTAGTATAGIAATQPDTTTDPAMAAILGQVIVQDGDLTGSGLTINPATGDGQVTGQVTLANCGHRFVSEKHRVARHKVTLANVSGTDAGLANEVVAYKSAGRAEEALREWRDSVTTCRKGTLIQQPETGTTRIRYDSEATASDKTLPIAANTVTTVTTTAVTNQAKRYQMIVLQQQGAVITIVWLSGATSLPRDRIDQAMSVASATGHRLAAG
jgi:hypothetical protein